MAPVQFWHAAILVKAVLSPSNNLKIVSSGNDRHAVPVYLLLTFSLSSVFYFLIIKSGHIGAGVSHWVDVLPRLRSTAHVQVSRARGRESRAFDNDGVTLYHGDCREILPELQSETFEPTLTDPPYLVSHSGRWGGDGDIIEGDSDPRWVQPVYS
jgi:hypothetical protein